MKCPDHEEKNSEITVFLKISTASKLISTNKKMFLRYFLGKKDSKSKIKTNSSPGLIRAYVRTYVRRRQPNFLALMGLLISMPMDAPARGRLRRPRELRY